MRNGKFRRGAGALWVVALWLVVSVGCGHRGAPIPPLPHLPEPPRNVEWRQRADRLEWSAAFRLRALEGGKLKPPVRPVLLALQPRHPDDLSGWDSETREHEFLRDGREIPSAPFAPSAVQSGAEEKRAEGLALGQIDSTGPVVLALALVDRSSRSTPSPRLVLRPAIPALPVPSKVEIRGEVDGVRLIWTAPEDRRVKKIRVYRWRGTDPEPWTPWQTIEAAETEIFDREARYGDLLNYAVAYGGDEGIGVAIESALKRVPAFEYRDLFPPEPPRDVDAVAETLRIRVLWYPGHSPDDRGAAVERQTEGEEDWKRLGVVEVPESFFEDRGVVVGKRYRYRVVALDRAGNQAQVVGPTAWVTPRPEAP